MFFVIKNINNILNIYYIQNYLGYHYHYLTKTKFRLMNTKHEKCNFTIKKTVLLKLFTMSTVKYG